MRSVAGQRLNALPGAGILMAMRAGWIAVATIALGASPGAAQVALSGQAGWLRIEDRGVGFSLESVGGARYEGRAAAAPLLGAVLGVEVVPAVTLEVEYARAWSSLGMAASIGGIPLPDPVREEGTIVVDMYALRGRVSYPLRSPVRGSVLLGRGTINADVDVATLREPVAGGGFGPSGSTAREPMWELGVGIDWRAAALWGARIELVDRIQRCSGETHSEINVCGRDGSIDELHHLSLTGGASLRF